MQNGAVTLKTIWWFLIKQNIFIPYESVIVLLDIYPKRLKSCPHRDLHMDGYSSIIHNHPNLEATKRFFSNWIDTYQTSW